MSVSFLCSHEKADDGGGNGGKDASRRLGLLSVLTLSSYLAYELFWLYAYTTGRCALVPPSTVTRPGTPTRLPVPCLHTGNV